MRSVRYFRKVRRSSVGVGKGGKIWGCNPPEFSNLTFFCYTFTKKGRFLSFEKEK